MKNRTPFHLARMVPSDPRDRASDHYIDYHVRVVALMISEGAIERARQRIAEYLAA